VEAGQQLFEARQRHGLTLDDISRTTKIPVSLLRAIERNDAARLPQGFFTRAFVRAYAAEVGLDADHILESFDRTAIEEVRLDPHVSSIPVQEPASSKSLLGVVALCAALTMFYSGYASQTTAPLVSDAEVPSQSAPADPITTVSTASPCPGTPPAVTTVQIVRRKDVAAQTSGAPEAISVTHVVEDPPIEPAPSGLAPSPTLSDAVLPQPDVAPLPAPTEQF
jgi:cytoskeletal protein RodZ